MSEVASKLAALGSSLDRGLGSREATARLICDGANEVPERPSHPFARFAGKSWGLSAGMIELIAVLSFILHKRTDTFVALALLLVNAVLSFLQEQRASAAIAALWRRLQVTGPVLRDGAWQTVAARMLVRGDIICARAGDVVPPDALVLDGSAEADQADFTGESMAVDNLY